MKKTLHLVSILDRSGSMAGSEVEVVGAYNQFIKEHQSLAKKEKVKIKTTLVLFDNQYEEVYSNVSIKKVPTLTSDMYFARGLTALNDAVGKTILSCVGKNNVLFFIETDGHENASKEFSSSQVKALVEKYSAEGWDFNFVGSDLSVQDTNTMASALGVTKSAAFSKSSAGYTSRNETFLETTRAYVSKD